jgi:Protein of unknown function (DUF2752)
MADRYTGRDIVLIAVPLLAALVPMSWLERAPEVCLIKRVTGRPCWGCGMTRAIASLLRGRFRKAVRYNPRVVIVGPLLGYLWLKELGKR